MQREALLRSVFSTFYDEVPRGDVVFDTNRVWCARLPLLTALFPQAKVICCVRDMPWIFNSIEQLIRKNKFQPSGIFGFEPGGTVYSRVEGLGSATAWSALPGTRCAKRFAASTPTGYWR